MHLQDENRRYHKADNIANIRCWWPEPNQTPMLRVAKVVLDDCQESRPDVMLKKAKYQESNHQYELHTGRINNTWNRQHSDKDNPRSTDYWSDHEIE